jgi:hypothetical protein
LEERKPRIARIYADQAAAIPGERREMAAKDAENAEDSESIFLALTPWRGAHFDPPGPFPLCSRTLGILRKQFSTASFRLRAKPSISSLNVECSMLNVGR